MSHKSILDKSFEVEGIYLLTTKTGAKYAYSKRSEVWNDKAKAQHMTLTLWEPTGSALDKGLIDCLVDWEFWFHQDKESNGACISRVDVRYNDVSTVLEIETT